MKFSWYLLPLYAALVLAQGPVATEPKIFFLGTMGGISHTAWVIEILDLVRTRGYNVSYVSYQANQKYIKNYPEVGFIPLQDPNTSVHFNDFFDLEQAYSKKVVAALTSYFKDTFADQLSEFIHLMNTEKPDVMMCDHTAIACMDAAHHLNITVVLTSTVKVRDEPPDQFSDVTTLDSDIVSHSYVTRLIASYRYIRERLRILLGIWPLDIELKRIRRQVKVEKLRYVAPNSGAVKLVNQMFPLENPYPLNANEHYIGPIFISRPQPLSDKLATFLDSHKKVVYVAFGQMYTPTQHEFNALVQALLTNYRHGIIDGFIWATVGLPTSMLDIFQSNRTINSLGFANNPDFLFEQWVPQYSVLNHTSTKLFISHAGTASTHEAVFNGVPILAHPFSSDQPANAMQLEKAGVALVNDRKTCTAESISRKIKTIMKDRYSEFVTKANELRGLAYIASRRKSLAADILEQLALYSRHGKAWFYQQDEPTYYLFIPSWYKLCLAYIAIKVGSLGVRTFRKQISEMAYRTWTQGRDLTYGESKKLQ
ncbi:hypothetical protein K450DRAFT_196939 [Umbelopsis ramanniana AG]|uniref:Uncharacterized protein n=1 Tax=Umbelopsis ramanniana AG TaxID=1314678 RepID=A0AAD5EHV4_UMBRA|nr:uncharacterized protein K450DRAFT_196939 [Umbelopsis ramanniana AG]KAI8582580.1 hypothetical protein K450DRAFT_196939 [Umbelopsis ramanniana AG]